MPFVDKKVTQFSGFPPTSVSYLKEPSLPNLHISRFGVIPKSTPGKLRLLTDLSYRQGSSINNRIPMELCCITCKGIQEAIDKIMRFGRGALMAKFDVSRKYRCFPICESVRYLLEMYWERNYHVNLALRLDVARAPNIFNRGGDLLEWIFGDSTL